MKVARFCSNIGLMSQISVSLHCGSKSLNLRMALPRRQDRGMALFYTIKEAIRTGHRIRLSLEPHVLGRNKQGKTLLRAFKLHGPGPPAPWQLFDLEGIRHAREVS